MENPRMMLFLLLAGCAGSDLGVKTYNAEPTVTIQNPVDGASFNEGDTISFTAKAGDDRTPSDELEIQWASDVDGVLKEGKPDAAGNIAFATASLSPAAHIITLSVLDEEGLQGQSILGISIIDLPEAPTITMDHPRGTEKATEGTEFEFKAFVSDAQDEPGDLQVTFNSDIDGDFCTPVADSTGYASCLYDLSPNDHYLTFTVVDTAGETGTATWPFSVWALSEIDNDGDGFTEEQGDCDDTSSANKPGATEVEDGVDNDCDLEVDEGTNAFDDDKDGWSENDGDCDDYDPRVSPDAIEDCNSSQDDNCDGSLSEEDALNCSYYYYDYDGDGFGSDAVAGKCLCALEGGYTVGSNTDCYDYNAAANPGASTYSVASRGDGSYDWNCDGTEQKYWSSAGDSCDFNIDFDNFCEFGEGWASGVAACGSTAPYITGCDGDFFSCDDDTDNRQQSCL